MTAPTTAPAVTLRPATPADEPVLYRVYASTRAEEMALVPWSAAEKEAFLRMQFNAQHRYYQEHYPDAAFDLILLSDTPAGRLYVDRWDGEIRIIDITLLPEYRNRGIGGALLHGLLAEADRAGKPISIHVEQYNPAQRLYRRLGFVPVDQHGIYFLMRRPAPPASSAGP